MAKYTLNTNSSLIEYDDVTQLYKPNPTDNAEMINATGLTSLDTLTLAEMSTALFDGNNNWCSGADLADPLQFRFIHFRSTLDLSQNDLDKARDECNRPPDLTYNDLLVIGQDVDVNASFQYIAEIDVYENSLIATTFNYTMQFIEDDFRNYTFSDISYTDPRNGKTTTLSPLTVTYQEFAQIVDPTLLIDAPLNSTTQGENLTGLTDDFAIEYGTPSYAVDSVLLPAGTNLVLPNSIGELLQYNGEWTYLIKIKTPATGSFFVMGNHSNDVHDGIYMSSSSGLRTWYRDASDTHGGGNDNQWITIGVSQRLVSEGVYDADLYINGVFEAQILKGAVTNITNHFRLNGEANQSESVQDVIGVTTVVTTGDCSYKEFKYYTRKLDATDHANYHNNVPIAPPA